MPLRGEKKRAYYRDWQKRNREKCRSYEKRYTASEKGQAAARRAEDRRRANMRGAVRQYPPKPVGSTDRYPKICSNNQTYQVHTLVMESMLGRKLIKGESVHHKNGNRGDYRKENLELWSNSQPSGQRVEDKVHWAREILALYGEGKY